MNELATETKIFSSLSAPKVISSQVHQINGQLFCQYGSNVYFYDKDKDEWIEFIKAGEIRKKDTDMNETGEKVERLENRCDFAELDICDLRDQCRTMSMRIRRMEVRERRLANEKEKWKFRTNLALAALTGLMISMSVWGHGVIDKLLSLF